MTAGQPRSPRRGPSPDRRPDALLPSLWALLAAEEVRYCLLRGSERLERPTGDVDLLVHPSDIEGLHDVAGRAGFALRRRWGQDTQHHLLGLDDGHPVALHCVTEIGFGPPDYPWVLGVAAHVLDGAVTGPFGAPVMAADADEFWISLHHCLLDKIAVATHHRRRLSALRHRAGADDPVAAHLPAALRRDLLGHVEAGRWEALVSCAPRVRRAVRRRQRIAAPVRRRIRRAELVGRKLMERGARRGLSVALLAPDGAGKSTLAEGLSDVLPLPSHRAYLGIYQRAGRGRGITKLPGISLASRIGRMWRTWMVARYHQSRRRVVIFDRHPLDALLPRPGSGPGDRLRRWLLGHALPRPDLVLILDAPGEVLHERSGEHDPRTLQRQRRGYLALARQLSSTTVMDATRPPADVVAEAVEVVWQAHLQRNRARGRR